MAAGISLYSVNSDRADEGFSRLTFGLTQGGSGVGTDGARIQPVGTHQRVLGGAAHFFSGLPLFTATLPGVKSGKFGNMNELWQVFRLVFLKNKKTSRNRGHNLLPKQS